MKIEVSNGELLDKLSILEIKEVKITADDQLKNIRHELNLLREDSKLFFPLCNNEYEALKEVNLVLWNIEDRIRELELRKDFGHDFIETARAVYLNNDRRANIKREINTKTGSALFEEKSYADYS